MALDKDYLESLGLEIAKKKYYNAARVESVIEQLDRRAAALEADKRALQDRLSDISFGREEIGDAILSAKTISQQMIAEAREKSERMLAEAREEAGRLLAEAQEKRERTLAECGAREQEAVQKVQSCYLQLRELYVGALRRLDGEWQGFLCSLDAEAQQPWIEEERAGAVSTADAAPPDLTQRLSAIADQLQALGDED